MFGFTRRSLLALALIPSLVGSASPALAQSAPGCQFILGFKTLHDLAPGDIGDCLDNQAFAGNGDAQQHTTKGLLAWRKSDNWTAFTNGYMTWINGPNGLVTRLNTARFPWEHDQAAPSSPIPAAPSGPTGVVPAKPGVTFGDGSYAVNKDIGPGTYRTRAGSSGCKWQRLGSDSSGKTTVLFQDVFGGPVVVTINPTDSTFTANKCGTWTSDLSPITSSPTADFGDGMYLVGPDIAPGTWQSSGGTDCFWARLSGFTGDANFIDGNLVDGPATVSIAPTDAGFRTWSCGTWTKAG